MHTDVLEAIQKSMMIRNTYIVKYVTVEILKLFTGGLDNMNITHISVLSTKQNSTFRLVRDID